MTDTVSTTTDHRPVFTRVTEDDQTRIEIDLEHLADKLLVDIFTALHRQHRFAQAMQIGNPRTTPLERIRLRNQVLAALAQDGVFTHELGDDTVEPMQAELEEATRLPDWCDECSERYATIGDRCGHCDEVASFRNALAGGRL